MSHSNNRLNRRRVPRLQRAAGMVLAMTGAAACGENSVTNNYYTLPPTPQEASVDAGEAGVTLVPASSDPTNTSQPPAVVDASASSDTSEQSSIETASMSSEVTLETSVDDAGTLDATGPAMPLEDGAPVVNSTPTDLDFDLFGTFNNKFWFVVSEEQVERMNQRDDGGPCVGCYGDIYAPNSPASNTGKTYSEHMLVTNSEGQTADFGKVQTKVKGESTFRPWTESTLPNIRVDMDEFVKGQSLDGFEHLRFNNALVGSIFREKFTFDYYREMGYPAPYSSYGWVSNSIWGEGVEVPYVVSEVYKRSFCSKRLDYFGGECPNMWEFYGDIGRPQGYNPWYEPYGAGGGYFDDPQNCQFDVCESTRASEFEATVVATEHGPGFKEALSEYLDWDAYHDFQCLSWIFATGDDTFHNDNNNLIVERADGKFQWLPYSIDISFGQEWYRYVELPGNSTLARGCQADPECWADTIAACDVMLQRFVDSDPVARLDALYSQLDEAGMLRSGDDGRYQDMRGYIEERLVDMPGELDLNRDAPYYGQRYCEYPYVQCGEFCELPRDCPQCGEYYVDGHDYGYYSETMVFPLPGPPLVDPPAAAVTAPAIVIAPPLPGPAPVPTAPIPPPMTTAEPTIGDGGVPYGDGGVPYYGDGGGEIPPMCRPYTDYAVGGK